MKIASRAVKHSFFPTLALLLAAVVNQAQQNTSVVSQTGNAQSASATQTGSANESIIRQLTGTSSVANEGNQASTRQTATSNTPVTN